ncbi:MAG: pseudouridylate synthase [uncultured archaeon A07HN63]|nr:MAG: pseudouridylate synthase [uncultured archaeon A07HN63]
MRAFRLAYDGRPFYGFQRQPSVPTVEGALFDALRALSVISPKADKPTDYAAAGRTDAGVSAVAQTVAFECPEWLSPRALNGELPATVRAWASADVADAFHATHDAVRREYVYHWYAPSTDTEHRPLDGRQPVDDDRVAAAVDTLAGAHDFHNLTPDDTGTARDLTIAADRDGDMVRLSVAADGFARHLVRGLVSVISAVATGEQSVGWIETLLGDETVLPRPRAAPPEPLVLSRVAYPGVAFDRDPAAVESAVDALGDRAVDARIASEVGSALVDRLAGGTDRLGDAEGNF